MAERLHDVHIHPGHDLIAVFPTRDAADEAERERSKNRKTGRTHGNLLDCEVGSCSRSHPTHPISSRNKTCVAKCLATEPEEIATERCVS